MIFDLRSAKYSLNTEHERCTLHLWSEESNMVRRVVSATLRAGALHLGNYRLGACTLYATLEPCCMCMGALINARVARLVFGAWDTKAGACGSVIDLSREPRLTHRVDVFGGVCSDESTALLQEFFESRR